MNNINKKDIFDLICRKVQPNKMENDYVKEIVEELYNLEQTIVVPFDKEETHVFRLRYGILNNGVPQSVENIVKETNLSHTKVRKILDNSFFKLSFRIKKMGSYNKVNRMSSIDLNDNRELAKNITISSFELNSPIKNKLTKSFIITLKDLMEYSIFDLEKILHNEELKQLVNYIHSFHISFLDELTTIEKREIVLNSSLEKVFNSSIYWIESVKKLPKIKVDMMQVHNIKEFLNKIDNLKPNEQKMIMKSLVEEEMLYMNNMDKSIKF